MTFTNRESCVRCFWRETSLFSSRSVSVTAWCGREEKGCNCFTTLITLVRSKRLSQQVETDAYDAPQEWEAGKVTERRRQTERALETLDIHLLWTGIRHGLSRECE